MPLQKAKQVTVPPVRPPPPQKNKLKICAAQRPRSALLGIQINIPSSLVTAWPEHASIILPLHSPCVCKKILDPVRDYHTHRSLRSLHNPPSALIKAENSWSTTNWAYPKHASRAPCDVSPWGIEECVLRNPDSLQSPRKEASKKSSLMTSFTLIMLHSNIFCWDSRARNRTKFKLLGRMMPVFFIFHGRLTSSKVRLHPSHTLLFPLLPQRSFSHLKVQRCITAALAGSLLFVTTPPKNTR